MKLQTILSGAMLGVNVILGFAVATMLVWMLGASGYGIYSYVYVLFAMVSVIIQLGIPRLAVRETAKALAAGDWEMMKSFWRWAGRSTFLFSLVVTAGAVLIAWSMNENALSGQRLLIVLGALTVPLATFGALRGGILRGLGHVVLAQLPETLLRNLFFAFSLMVLLLVSGTMTPAQAMGLQFAVTAAAFIIGAWLLLSRIPAEISSVQVQKPAISKQWWTAAMFMGISVGMNQIISYADLLILQLFQTAEELGVYRIVYQISMFVAFGVQAVTLVFAPRFASTYANEGRRSLQHLVTLSVRISFLVALPIAVFFIIFGKLLLSLVFGEVFAAGYGPLVILVLAQLAIAGFGSIGTLMNMTGNESRLTQVLIYTAICNVILNFALIPTFGLAGAAIATFLSIVSGNLLTCVIAYRKLGISSHIFASGSLWAK